MTHGSVFSGIGGFDLAADWMKWENIFHCELVESKRVHLKKRFKNSISHGDITKTDFTVYRGKLSILTGGFPCQDASIAKQDGKGQQGLQGERTGLFYEMLRCIREVQPKYIVAENVSNILKINRGKDFYEIITELAAMGYNAEWRVCYASEVGAPHPRPRLYIVAYPASIRLQEDETFFKNIRQEVRPFTWEFSRTSVQISTGGYWSLHKPPTIRMDDGVSTKLVSQQLHGYGNAIVPEIGFQIFKAIQEYENLHNANK